MNNEAIKQKTNELAELLRNSDEHRIYLDAKTRAYGNESTRRLLDEYRILQTRVQAGTLAGDGTHHVHEAFRNDFCFSQSGEKTEKLGGLFFRDLFSRSNAGDSCTDHGRNYCKCG